VSARESSGRATSLTRAVRHALACVHACTHAHMPSCCACIYAFMLSCTRACSRTGCLYRFDAPPTNPHPSPSAHACTSVHQLAHEVLCVHNTTLHAARERERESLFSHSPLLARRLSCYGLLGVARRLEHTDVRGGEREADLVFALEQVPFYPCHHALYTHKHTQSLSLSTLATTRCTHTNTHNLSLCPPPLPFDQTSFPVSLSSSTLLPPPR